MIWGDTGYNDYQPMFEFFIKDEIKQRGPVTVGFDVTAAFQPFFTATPTATMVVTDSDEVRIHGGHAVAIVGWGVDNGQKYWLCRNSWGRSFADSGYFRMEIGGGVASRMRFTTNSMGMGAMTPLLQSGSTFRRLKTEASHPRKLAQVTTTASEMTTVQAHGGWSACSDHHKTEIDALRVWFLSNKTNYNGVSPSCSVPWTYDSMNGCTAQSVSKGLHIKTTFHVKDCNNTMYHISVRLIHDGSMTSPMVVHNSGPDKVNPAPNHVSANPQTNTDTSSGANSLLACTKVVSALLVGAWMMA